MSGSSDSSVATAQKMVALRQGAEFNALVAEP